MCAACEARPRGFDLRAARYGGQLAATADILRVSVTESSMLLGCPNISMAWTRGLACQS